MSRKTNFMLPWKQALRKDKTLPALVKATLRAIADQSNGDGYSFMKVQTLADSIGIKERAAQRRVLEAEKTPWLEVTHSRGGRGLVNQFQLLNPVVDDGVSEAKRVSSRTVNPVVHDQKGVVDDTRKRVEEEEEEEEGTSSFRTIHSDQSLEEEEEGGPSENQPELEYVGRPEPHAILVKELPRLEKDTFTVYRFEDDTGDKSFQTFDAGLAEEVRQLLKLLLPASVEYEVEKKKGKYVDRTILWLTGTCQHHPDNELHQGSCTLCEQAAYYARHANGGGAEAFELQSPQASKPASGSLIDESTSAAAYRRAMGLE